MSKVLGIGICGCRNVRWAYADVASPYSRLVAICDTHKPAIEAARREFPDIAAYTDYRVLVTHPHVDVVVVNTPNWLHPEITIAALEAGKDVFCEKPMALNREDCARMLAAERASGRTLCIDFELRYSILSGRRLKELISSGEIGEVRHIDFFHYRGAWLEEGNGIWRTRPELSGGLYPMEPCHEVDLFRYLVGEISAVQSFSAPNVLPHYRIPDNVCTHFFFENGAMGQITTAHTRSAHIVEGDHWEDLGHEMVLSIVGTQGSLRVDLWKNRLTVFRFAEYPLGSGGVRCEFVRNEDYTGVPSHLLHHDMSGFRRDFFRRLATGQPPMITALDSWRTHAVCFAAEQSALAGFRKIEVDYDLPQV